MKRGSTRAVLVGLRDYITTPPARPASGAWTNRITFPYNDDANPDFEVVQSPVTRSACVRASGSRGARINGTSGDDVLVGTDGDDVMRCGAGNDRVDAGGGDDDVFCGSGDDDVFGDSGDDFLDGGAGDDRLVGGSGEDRFDGGSGRDSITQ